MTDLRLQHLWSASHALTAASPHLSSYYMLQFMKHAASKELNLSDATRRVYCSFCGSVFLPGVNCIVQIVKKHRKKAKKNGKSKCQEENRNPQHPPIHIPYHDSPLVKSRNYIAYTCNRCSRQTRFQGSISHPPQNSAKINAATSLPFSTSVQGTSSVKNKPTTEPAATPTVGKKKKGKKMDLKNLLVKEKEKMAGSHGKGLSLGLEDFLSSI